MHEPVAIVHDWLTSMRGGERVVEVLCDMFPQADLFTLTWDPKRLSPALARRSATTSAIHSVATAPFVHGRFRGLLPLFPLAIESFNLDRYALVVSSSHCVAIGAIAPPTALHVAYVHSTLRYVREDQATYEASVPGGRVGRALFRGTAQYLRHWDTTAATRPHLLIANSTYTSDRVRRYYQRDALVIEPPIETSRFERAAARAPKSVPDAPFLMISALVPNKRVDLALRAFQGRHERLVVVGEGPERARLERLTGPNVTLLSRVSEADLDALCANCRALIHTGLDDFGLVMVEALAAGKPVIARAIGGALDIVRDGETGLLIEAATVESVRAALDRFAHMSHTFDSVKLQSFAKRFDRSNFERRFGQAVEEAWDRHSSPSSNGAGGSRGHAGPEPMAKEPSATNHSSARLTAKRLIDIAVAASGLVLTAPLVAALGALVTLDSSGPALFHQRRTGRDQRPFTLVKLRTFDRQGRVTRVGRVLRPTGLDELPQLWNILTGEMSLIGPRPEVPDRVERFARVLPAFRARHLMRPGITGWAQVNGLRGLRGDVAIAERLRFDLEYQRKWSLALDARILMRTVLTVVSDTIRELGA
jgi:lipopolysaccharide/colanic/teichoic acid biosynthesis glycosyltransferase/glycosyltransferase involved in cell wall biosynthesis